MSGAEVFLLLLFIHFLMDYPLQGDFLANVKGDNVFLLFVHSSLWGLPIYLACSVFGSADLPLLAFLILGHMAVDKWKCGENRYCKDGALTKYLYIDQAFHLVQIIVVYIFSFYY